MQDCATAAAAYDCPARRRVRRATATLLVNGNHPELIFDDAMDAARHPLSRIALAPAIVLDVDEAPEMHRRKYGTHATQLR